MAIHGRIRRCLPPGHRTEGYLLALSITLMREKLKSERGAHSASVIFTQLPRQDRARYTDGRGPDLALWFTLDMALALPPLPRQPFIGIGAADDAGRGAAPMAGTRRDRGARRA